MQNINQKYDFIRSLLRSFGNIPILFFLPTGRSYGTLEKYYSPKFSAKYLSSIGAAFFILLGLTFMSSCRPDTKPTEQALDSLALNAWEAEAEITGIETEAWKNLCAEAKQNVEFINFNFKDTMSRETALAIDNYARAAKTLEAFVNDFSTIKEQVGLAAEQVNKLKTDFTKQAQPLDSINAYIKRETKNLEVLNQSVAAKTGYAREQAELVQHYAPEVDSVIVKLKNNE
jgi:uncharacterized protein YoxC